MDKESEEVLYAFVVSIIILVLVLGVLHRFDLKMNRLGYWIVLTLMIILQKNSLLLITASD